MKKNKKTISAKKENKAETNKTVKDENEDSDDKIIREML